MERRLIADTKRSFASSRASLDPDNHALAVEIASLPAKFAASATSRSATSKPPKACEAELLGIVAVAKKLRDGGLKFNHDDGTVPSADQRPQADPAAPRRSARAYADAAGRQRRLDRSLFDDLAAIHHQHAAAQMAHDGEIVRDKQHGEAELGAQPRQKIEKLRLNRDIEPGNDLIGDQNLRNVAKRARDIDALALAARQLSG